MIKSILLALTLIGMFVILLIGIAHQDKTTREFERKCKEEEDSWS